MLYGIDMGSTAVTDSELNLFSELLCFSLAKYGSFIHEIICRLILLNLLNYNYFTFKSLLF